MNSLNLSSSYIVYVEGWILNKGYVDWTCYMQINQFVFYVKGMKKIPSPCFWSVLFLAPVDLLTAAVEYLLAISKGSEMLLWVLDGGDANKFLIKSNGW